MMMTGKHWVLAAALLALAACSDKPAEVPAGDVAAPAPAAEPAVAPATAPGPAVAPVATNAALQASDIDAYLLGLAKEVQLLRDEYAKIEQARAADDSAAETDALFAMTANGIDEAGAHAAGLALPRYGFIKERIDTTESKLEMLAGLATMEGDTTAFYLTRKLRDHNLRITTIARGVPVGGELEYTEEITLGRSIVERTAYGQI